jgi:hypothetical protein
MPCATLTVTAPAQPNIEIVSVRLDPSTVDVGASVNVYATIRNTGNAKGDLYYAVIVGGNVVRTGMRADVPSGYSGEFLVTTITAAQAGTWNVCVEKR